MPFCTIVEFAWDGSLDRERFESITGGTRAGPVPDGLLARIAGLDDVVVVGFEVTCHDLP